MMPHGGMLATSFVVISPTGMGQARPTPSRTRQATRPIVCRKNAWPARSSRADQPASVCNYYKFSCDTVKCYCVYTALKAARKNRQLLTEYLARGPSQRFLKLAQKYRLDLEQFL